MTDSPLTPKGTQLLARGQSVSGVLNARRKPFIWIAGGLVAGGLGATILGADIVLSLSLFGAGVLALLRVAMTRKPVSPQEIDALERQARLKELTRYIGKTRYLEYVEDLGEQAAEQMAQASGQFKSFQDLLGLKFAPNELTFGRYYNAGEQTFLAILDNLSVVAATLNSINVVDPGQLNARLEQLKKDGGGADDATEIKALEERKNLRNRDVRRVTELLAFNEGAITEFSRIRVALAEIRTRKGESDIGLESAMAELTLLANRAQKYALERRESSDGH